MTRFGIALAALPKHSLRASRSDADGVEFGGSGDIFIVPAENGSAERRIRLRANLDAQASASSHALSFSGEFTDAQLAALARGERVEVAAREQAVSPMALFELNGRPQRMRPVLAVTMTHENHSARVTLELGDEIVDWPPTAEPVDRISLELHGQLGVVCGVFHASGWPLGDPRWASDFCRTARSELGLSEWIEDLL